ncbi:phosphotransferase system sugar-specific EII component [Streptococcus pneumoniae]|nr:phosphotransferase system sugar-specific EII component [Streptococcus pneumoniae]
MIKILAACGAGVNSSSSQTNILAQLMDFFTGNGHLEDLSKISEPEALYAYIDEAIA